MASRTTRKTWETAFLLSASMSSSYQETFDRASEIMRELGADNVQLGDEAERAAQRQENAFQLAAAAIAETGLTEMLGQVKDAYADIITVTEEFEYTMSAVEAIASASADDVAKLEAKARELGETTVYTAQQSSEAMTFMAQAGWDTTEMLSGMSGVISLAAASGTDLAETSSIVADTLAGFGMAADETGRLADVLAQTSARSNTNVSMMGQTFSNVAATAGALGFSIEDVSVMLGTMANAGIKSAKAGTQLRMILNGLSEDITLTGESFGEANLSLFDENGDAVSLMETVRQLRGYFDQMTTAEKIENAKAIAGKRNYNGLLAIVNATDEQFEELYADIQNADGAAKKMADTRLDNLKGDVTLLNSALESLKITIGEELTGSGRGVVGALTRLVTGANAFIGRHPEIISAVTGITAAVGGATVALTGAAGAIKAISAVKLVAALLGGGPAAPVVAGIGALVAGLAAMNVLLNGQKTTAQELSEQYETLNKEYADTVAAIDGQYTNTQSYIAILDELSSKENRSESDKARLLAVVNKLKEAVPELGLEYDYYTDKLNMSADAVKNLARAEYLRKAQAERWEQLQGLAGLEVEQESELLNLKAEDSGLALRQEEIAARLKELDDAASLIDYILPTANTRETAALEREAESILRERINIASDMSLLRQAHDETQKQYGELYNEYAQKESQFDLFWDRAVGETPEIAGEEEAVPDAADIQAEEKGRSEIKKVERGVELDAADVMKLTSGTWVSSEDVSDQYSGAAPEPEGAVIASDSGDTNVTVNVNVAGNVTEDSISDVERAAEEAAEKVISYMRQESRQRSRLGFN